MSPTPDLTRFTLLEILGVIFLVLIGAAVVIVLLAWIGSWMEKVKNYLIYCCVKLGATTLRADLETARNELARVNAKAEAAEARAEKLKAATARKRGTATGRKRTPATARKSEAATVPATAPEEVSDVDSEMLVLKYLAEGHSASKAGVMAGLTDSRGRQIARKLAAAAPKGQDPEDSP